MGILKAFEISSRKEKNLKQTGQPINAVIVDVAVNNSVSINGRNPRKLICEGVLPNGTKQYFESSNVSALTHPSVIGNSIIVYVDRNDYSKYYVDVAAYK